MRVTIVSPYDPRPAGGADPKGLRGGVEESLDRCARGLAARGHDVTLLCSSSEAGESLDHDGVRVLRLRRRGSVFRVPLAALWRHVPQDAEVVHVPATYPLVSDLVPLTESKRRAVIVDYHFDVHGTSAPMRLANALYAATMGRSMGRATRIVAKSLDYARHSRVLKHLPRERIEWVPNGVDLRDFPLHEGTRRDLLCVGRLVPYKGVDVLIRAMPSIHERTGARLTLIGDGPESARLRSLAAQIGAPVDFLGRVPTDDVRRAYARHRLTVLPSVNSQEAFGIVLLESLATGTPVVASDLPGVREIAAIGGDVAPAGDADALAATVSEAYADPGAFGSPSEIRARVAQRYAWPRVVAQLEAVYTRALNEPSHAARRAPQRTRTPAGGAS